jgi:hypothetical protein
VSCRSQLAADSRGGQEALDTSQAQLVRGRERRSGGPGAVGVDHVGAGVLGKHDSQPLPEGVGGRVRPAIGAVEVEPVEDRLVQGLAVVVGRVALRRPLQATGDRHSEYQLHHVKFLDP